MSWTVDNPGPPHDHEWERGSHMAQAFGVDGRTYACAICGVPRPQDGEPVSDSGRRQASKSSGGYPKEAVA